jgi:nucleotide-binding universal stress UspA family protein
MTVISVYRGWFHLSLLPVSAVNFMSKSILCAIDFSESSLNALKWAAEFSAKFNSHLTVLYPYRLLQTSKEDVVELKRKNVELATRKFEALENDYLNGKVTSFEFSPEVGFLSDRIEDHLRKNHILMMVIGKNMNSASQENLDDLLHQVKVPVVVIP